MCGFNVNHCKQCGCLFFREDKHLLHITFFLAAPSYALSILICNSDHVVIAHNMQSLLQKLMHQSQVPMVLWCLIKVLYHWLILCLFPLWILFFLKVFTKIYKQFLWKLVSWILILKMKCWFHGCTDLPLKNVINAPIWDTIRQLF